MGRKQPVYVDSELKLEVVWNGSKTWNVYSNGVEVDCFTAMEAPTSFESARKRAKQWIEYARDAQLGYA